MSERNGLTAIGDKTSTAWGIFTKFCLVAVGLFLAGLIVCQVMLECRYDRVCRAGACD